ncbi:MAG: hypothetical protein HY879_07730 [Deltaproteobacteria bacterium]|nr:hypothetical protein [Deltaproteobacteria bacterium]
MKIQSKFQDNLLSEGNTEPSYPIISLKDIEHPERDYGFPTHAGIISSLVTVTTSSATTDLVSMVIGPSPLIAGTGGFVLQQRPIDLLARSKQVKSVLQLAKNSIIGFIDKQLLLPIANDFLNKFYYALMKHDINVSNLKPLRAFEGEESILFEWIYPHWRIGFSFEQNQEDSSWFLASDSVTGNVQAYGDLISIDLLWILDWLKRRPC